MLIAFEGRVPAIDPRSWVASTATVIGDAELGAEASLWYGTVVRADCESIRIGEGSNVQDLCALHADPGMPLRVGSDVTVGHSAVLHGCTIEDEVIVGMGAVVLNRAVVGAGSIIGARALVPEEAVIPPRSVVLGMPGKVVREVDDAGLAKIRLNAQVYRDLARRHRALD